MPPDTKAINALVRLGLVTELYGKFARNHKRSQEFSPHEKHKRMGREAEEFQRAKNDYLNIKPREIITYKIKPPHKSNNLTEVGQSVDSQSYRPVS